MRELRIPKPASVQAGLFGRDVRVPCSLSQRAAISTDRQCFLILIDSKTNDLEALRYISSLVCERENDLHRKRRLAFERPRISPGGQR